MTSDETDWIPLRQAVVEVGAFYEKAMACTKAEATEHAWEAIWRRLRHGTATARSPNWWLIFQDESDRESLRLGSKPVGERQAIDVSFWYTLTFGGDTADWVAGEFSCFRDATPDWPNSAFGGAVDVEVERAGLPLIADSWWGLVPRAPDERARALLPPMKGRPKKHDWERAVSHVAAAAATGSPEELRTGYGAKADVARMLSLWFSENSAEEPAQSDIALRAKLIVEELEKLRK